MLKNFGDFNEILIGIVNWVLQTMSHQTFDIQIIFIYKRDNFVNRKLIYHPLSYPSRSLGYGEFEVEDHDELEKLWNRETLSI